MEREDWKDISEEGFEQVLKDSLSPLPPEDVVEEVTPWKKSMNCILTGLAMSAVTLNFFGLQYILPTIGLVLSILGFRALRRENKWFGACWVITLIRAVSLLPLLVVNATIYHTGEDCREIFQAVTVLNLLLLFLLILFLRKGFMAVQEKAGLSPHAGGAGAMLLWYGAVCLLALVEYNGLILGLGMVIAYVCIIRSLFKLSKELDEGGYSIQPAAVKMPDWAVAGAITAALAVGISCGYLFFDRYPMNWQPVEASQEEKTASIKAHLTQLGVPGEVLEDLSEEDLLSCEGALRVVVSRMDHPMSESQRALPCEGKVAGEPGVRELRITGVGIELPGQREQWKIIHHFKWLLNPGFYGTEVIQLWPACRAGFGGWAAAGEITGQVLYDEGGKTYVSPYESLGRETYSQNSMFFGTQTSSDVFATFSMPSHGTDHRGYVSYTIKETQDGSIVDAWFNYTHQRSLVQYPVITAKEKVMTQGMGATRPFITAQDALQFYPRQDSADLLFGD